MKKIAYLILAHDDATHLSNLVKAIDYQCNIFIHLDKKSDIDTFKQCVDLPNVIFIKDRVAVTWAGISMIDAEINLLREALKNAEAYTHVVFLSGSCYPIKPIKEIHHFFTSQPQREFIKFIDMRESPEHYMKQISRRNHTLFR